MNFPRPGPFSLAVPGHPCPGTVEEAIHSFMCEGTPGGNGPERTFQVWQESGPLVWQEMGYCLSQWPAGIPRALLGRRKRPCVSYFFLCPFSRRCRGGGLQTLHVAGACTAVGLRRPGSCRRCCVYCYGVFPLGFLPCVFLPGLGWLPGPWRQDAAAGRVAVCCSGWVDLFWDDWVPPRAPEGKSVP